MDFFNLCKDKDEAKKIYRQLCKQFHPDKGGDPELLKELIRQYEKFDSKIHNDQSYWQSAYGAPRYEFNKIRTGKFDSPDQRVIDGLSDRIKILERHIWSRDETIVELNKIIKIKNEQIGEKLSQVLYEQQKNIEMIDKIGQLEKEFEIKIKKMTIMEFLRLKWRQEDE